jgi:hypothetical protein
MISDIESARSFLVRDTADQTTMFDDLAGSTLEEEGNYVLGDFQNEIIRQEAALKAFKALVDSL